MMDPCDDTALTTLASIRDNLASTLYRESERYRLLVGLEQMLSAVDDRRPLPDAPARGAVPSSAAFTAGPPARTVPADVLGLLASRRRRTRPVLSGPGLLDREANKRDTVVMILREAGEPLHATELLDRMQKRGIPPRGRNPKGNLSSNLSQDDRFYPVRYNGQSCWWLVGEPVTPRATMPLSTGGEEHGDDDAATGPHEGQPFAVA